MLVEHISPYVCIAAIAFFCLLSCASHFDVSFIAKIVGCIDEMTSLHPLTLFSSWGEHDASAWC